MNDNSTMLAIQGLNVSFGSGRSASHILKNVSLSIPRGSTLGLVGESGSGKSTLGKALVGIVESQSGTATIDGIEVLRNPANRKRLRTLVQMVPQDPYSSLNPRMTIGEAISEAIDPRKPELRRHSERVAHWLETMRLSADMMYRYPHEFSGGQRQRIAVARALAVEPSFIIADEITSALDVSVQAELLALIANLKNEIDLTMLFISHNLAVVRQVSEFAAVMQRGELVEVGEIDDLFRRPQHAYTQQLLDSVPGSPTFSLR